MSRTASIRHLSPVVSIWRLAAKQTIKGAVIIGVLVAFMAATQGLAFGSTYPDDQSRQAFAATMQSAPALGILYGEAKDIVSSAGYMVYRTVPVMALVVSIWSLMTITKLLRGQEEDGRWETITAGATTARNATALTALGFGSSFLVAFLIPFCVLAAAGTFPELNITASTSLLVAVAIFLPGLLFAAAGVAASQLAITRRRATMYVLVPLLVLFGVRSIANTVPDLYWLKNISPFGWSDMINPIINPQYGWLLPVLVVSPLLIGLGIFLIGKRDYAAGFIAEKTKATSRYFLLGSATKLGLRQNFSLYLGWSIATLATSLLVASVMNIAAEAVADSPNLGAFVGELGGSMTDMKIAFLGVGMMFIVIMLLIMVTASVGSIRKQEAEKHLDTILAHPVRRSSWLAGRLIQILAAFTLISMLCVVSTWAVANAQGTSLELWNIIQIGVTLTGTVIFLLGFGTLLYGLVPRFASIGMYMVVAWSFLIDILRSVIDVGDIAAKSSLLHYVSLAPSQPPNWEQFAVLLFLGIIMATLGIIAFTRRDIVSE